MTVRDLGYRAYEGERLPASHNTWVLLRYGLWRALGAWINRLVILASPVMAVIAAGRIAITYFFAQAGGGAVDFAEEGPEIVGFYLTFQLWLLITVVTLRSGAGSIAEDATHKSFQFYFAKPVTRVQYLMGRIFSLILLTFSVLFVPALLVLAALVVAGTDEQIGEMWALAIPTFAWCLVASIVVSSLSVSISALSKSRALTMSSWMLLFAVPHVLAMLVDSLVEVGDQSEDPQGWPWLFLGSIPGMLTAIREGLFKITVEGAHVEWFQAAPVLVGLVGLGLYYAMHRLRKADVIT